MSSPNSEKFKDAGHAAGKVVTDLYDKEHGEYEPMPNEKKPAPSKNQEKPFK